MLLKFLLFIIITQQHKHFIHNYELFEHMIIGNYYTVQKLTIFMFVQQELRDVLATDKSTIWSTLSTALSDFKKSSWCDLET